eukprot:4022931-Pyramimonas_sp.AAC.1
MVSSSRSPLSLPSIGGSDTSSANGKVGSAARQRRRTHLTGMVQVGTPRERTQGSPARHLGIAA